MSGRDIRAFLSQHRSGTFNTSKEKDGLSVKYLVGGASLGGRGLKAPDYSTLLAQAKDYKVAGHLQFKKVKQISKKSTESKEAGLLRLHQEVWQHEWEGLVKDRSKAETDMEEWRVSCDGGDVTNMSDIIKDITQYEADLRLNITEFEHSTFIPAKILQVNLKNWIRMVGVAHKIVQKSDLLREISSVKKQQEMVEYGLREEYKDLWSDLVEFQKEHTNERRGAWLLGAPPSLQSHDMDCTNDELKNSLLEEFNKLDKHYVAVFDQLEQDYNECLSSRYGGWPQEEAERFEHILSQYPSSLHGRRRHAYLHRLGREFPQYTRECLVQHETWVLSNQRYSQKWEAYHREWLTQRKWVEVKVQELLIAHARDLEMKEAGLREREAQEMLCKQLSEKVSKWREEKQHQAVLEAGQEGALLLEEEAKRMKEVGEKRKKEKTVREKIHAYHRDKEDRRVREEVWLEHLRLETMEIRKEIIDSGRDRVTYRKKQLTKKLSQQNKYLEEKKKEEKEKEKRLDLLRQQVKVHVTSDPERLCQPTLSVQARMTFDPELPSQHPLFTLHGFPDNKVTSDPRIRLEVALRKAGLHATKYGRGVLASVQPPTTPRPDQQHSILFRDTEL